MQKHFESNTIRLLAFLLFISIFSILVSTFNAMIFILVFILIISILIILKYKTNIKKSDLIVGTCFAVLCMPSNFLIAIFVIPSYIASICVFKDSKVNISLFYNNKKYNMLKTIICIFVIGGILAGVNVLLVLSSTTLNITFQINWLFDALRAGIFEEICFRMFFFAICVLITENIALSRRQNFLCYAIMVFPYVLLHFNQGVDLGSVVMLALLYGLPFAIMQRKQNLISAIGAHSMVDLVRFVLLGI